MGGIGSGWYERKRTNGTVTHDRVLDINHWQRERLMKPGLRFNLIWGQQDKVTLGVAVRVAEDRIVLAYRYSQDDGPLTDVEYPIALDRIPSHFGGRRCWFHCPTKDCGRRAAKLYLGGTRFACRHCLKLAYPSQRENPIDRNLHRARKIRSKLGEVERLGDSPKKPKGMRSQTYERLLNEAEMAQFRAMRAVLDRIGGVDDRGM